MSLLNKILLQLNIPIELTNIIIAFLQNRNIYIKDNTEFLNSTYISIQGIAQGSLLSPILVNLYISSIYKIPPHNFQIVQYADDFVILVRGQKINVTWDEINKLFPILGEWFKKHNFKISLEKSSCTLFTKGNSKFTKPLVGFNSTNLMWKDHIKYLGVIIHKNLKWNQYIKLIGTKTSKGINILRSLCGTCWGGDPKTLLIIYKALIRIHLD